MIVIWIAFLCASEYFELLKNGTVERPMPPARCVLRECGRKNCYWRHGSYQRIVLDGDCSGPVTVERFKCKFCQATISMLPAFLVPKRWHSLRVIADKCERYATTETGYRSEANGPSAQPISSPSQIWRWLDFLSRKAKSLLLDVQAEAVTTKVEEGTLISAEEASCPNAWKAQTVGKRTCLDQLAKVVSIGGAIFGLEKGIVEAFGNRQLKNVEMMQLIVSGYTSIFETPQMVAPAIF